VVVVAPIRERLNVKTPEDAIPYLNLMVYGEPGAGKTWLAATAQDHEDTRPILFLDIEGGTTTIRKRRDVDVVQVRSMKQIEDVYAELRKEGSSPYYRTVIVDSLTELQKLDMRTVMTEQYNRKPDTTDIYVPSQREWGKSGERMRIIIRGFKDLPVNTITTCMLAQDRDDSTGITSFFPSLPGKLRSEIPGFFDVVGYLSSKTVKNGDQEEIVRTLQIARTRRVIAKDRTGDLGNLIENPSIPLMWELIHGQAYDSNKENVQ
jgi:phage nucleotide-binding protein